METNDESPKPVDPKTQLPRYAEWFTTHGVAKHVGASVTVVTNWIVTGVKSESGVIRMAAVKVGGRWRVHPDAVAEFFAATTRASLPASATAPAMNAPSRLPQPESPAARQRRAEASLGRLRAMGIATEALPVRRSRKGDPP